MVNIELFIGGKIVDISDDVSFRFNFQFTDISDINAARTSFSKPFQLPATKRNNVVFDNLYDLAIQSTYPIAERVPIVVKIDGIELIRGWSRIEKITIKDHAANSSAYYEVTISDEVNNIFKSLSGKKLNELDLSDFDHIFNLTNVTDSWNDFIKFKGQSTPVRAGFGYDYPLVDFGGKFSKPDNVDWYLTGFRPWPYAKTIIDYIFKEEGATYEGFFDTEYFKKLLISPDSEGQKLDDEELRARQFNVGLELGWTFSGTYSTKPGQPYSDPNISFTTTYATLDYYNPPNPGDTGIAGSGLVDPEFNVPLTRFASCHRIRYNEFQTFSDEVYHGGVRYTGLASLKKRVPFKIKVSQNGENYFDNSNQFSSATFSYIAKDYGLQNISITIPSMFRAHLPSYASGRPPFPDINTSPQRGFWPLTANEPDPATGGYDNSGLGRAGRGVIYGVYRTWVRRVSGSTDLLDTRVENYFWEPDNGVYTKFSSNDPVLWRERGYWIYEYIPPTTIPDDQLEFFMSPGDEVYVEFSYLCDLDNDVAKWVLTNCWAAVIHLSTGEDSFKNEALDNFFLEGNTIQLTRLLPDITRLEFLNSIFKLFNLYIIEDKVKQNHFIIKTRDNFFNFDRGLDWTYKLDRVQFEKKPIPLVTNGLWKFSYKPDVDFFNKNYTEDSGQVWGEFDVEVKEKGEGVKNITTLFSPSPLVYDSVTKRRVSRIFDWSGSGKVEVNNNPRILFKNYIVHNTVGVEDFNIIWSGGTYSATRHSTATHLDNPYDPEFDLNWFYNQSPGFYYINHPLVNKNLYNLFWRNTIENILDGDSYMLIGFFNLNLRDIWEFDFTRPIYIDTSWFYVNKIIDWNPDRKLTKVELIKIKDYKPGQFLPKLVTGRPTKGQINLGGGLSPVGTVKTIKSIRNPDVGIVIGNNTNVGKVKSPVINVGNGNIINDGGGVIVIGDGNSYAGGGSGGIIVGNDVKVVSGQNFNVGGQNIDVVSINNATIQGASVSVGDVRNSNVFGYNISLNEKVINSGILGENITIQGGDPLLSITNSNISPLVAPTASVADSSAKLDSVFIVGRDMNLVDKVYESGLVSKRLYFPSGPVIEESDGGIRIRTNSFTFSFGTVSIFPGAREIGRKTEYIISSSGSTAVNTRDEDYLINIEHGVQWVGPTNLGDIYLPNSALFPGREVVYKITSTYSMPGTYWTVTSAVDTIDYKTKLYLGADSNDSVTLVSDGLGNWNVTNFRTEPKTKGVGVFYSVDNQLIATASVPQIIGLGTYSISDGITLDTNGLIIREPATYKMTVTLLVESLSSGIEDVVFYLKFNGVEYPLSAHFDTIRERKNVSNPSYVLLSYDFIGTSQNEGDRVELWWYSTSDDVSLAFKAGSGGIPDSPSVIVNINKI